MVQRRAVPLLCHLQEVLRAPQAVLQLRAPPRLHHQSPLHCRVVRSWLLIAVLAADVRVLKGAVRLHGWRDFALQHINLDRAHFRRRGREGSGEAGVSRHLSPQAIRRLPGLPPELQIRMGLCSKIFFYKDSELKRGDFIHIQGRDVKRLTAGCSSWAEGHWPPRTLDGRPPGADGWRSLSCCFCGSSSPPGRTSRTCDHCSASLYHTRTFGSAFELYTNILIFTT